MPVDYGRVHRLLELISLIHSKQAGNTKALAERYGCAERTIFRDLAVLTDLGVPYYFDEQANGYRIRHDFFLPPVQLTAEEVLALTTLAEQVGKAEQVPFTAPAAKALEKLRGVLPEKVRRELGDLDEHIEVKLAATNDGTGIEDVFTVVSEANAARTGHRVSAWELAAVLYFDRGGPRRQQRCDVGRMLDLYASTLLIDARELTAGLYADRGDVHPQLKRYVEQVLDRNTRTPLLAFDGGSVACRLNRRVGGDEQPPERGAAAMPAMQVLHRHEVQPMTRDDLSTLDKSAEAPPDLRSRGPRRRCLACEA